MRIYDSEIKTEKNFTLGECACLQNSRKTPSHRYAELSQRASLSYTLKGKTHDAERTKILEKYGLYVLRFSNKDLDENFNGVCNMIDKTIQERMKQQTNLKPLTSGEVATEG